MIRDADQIPLVIVVAGGFAGLGAPIPSPYILSTVEILTIPQPFSLDDFLNQQWEEGPELPWNIQDAVILENPLTGFT